MDELTEIETRFLSHREALESAIRRGAIISYGIGEIQTDHARQYYCSILFLKLLVSCRSVLRSTPEASLLGKPEFLDVSASSALARVVQDTFVALFHFGLEQCSDEEHSVRQLLLFWRDVRVRSKMNSYTAEETARFEKDLRERLELISFWTNLREKDRRHLLSKADLLHSPDQILTAAGFDADERREMYAFFSAHAHCSSVSFIRMHEGGRAKGIINETDLGLVSLGLETSTQYLEYASDCVDKAFYGAYQRAINVDGFDPDALYHPARPWAGARIADLK